MAPSSQYSVTSEECDLRKSCKDLGMDIMGKALDSRRPLKPKQVLGCPPKDILVAG